MTDTRGRYDAPLDLNTTNSASVIVERVKPGSKVMEFGPAHGRMTRYMKEVIACDITIVEMDGAAGQQASQYANKAYVGPVNGNIEGYEWLKTERLELYDTFIFADVLEHLVTPWQVLKQIEARMKPGAQVIVSVPNIGYYGLLYELVQQKFDYRAVGLLDHTHLRFFTHNTLGKMVDQVGFKIVDAANIALDISYTEFNGAGQNLPPAVRDFIAAQIGAEIYQFVVVLNKK